MSHPVISVENLGKRYRLRHQSKAGYTTLRETLAAKARWLVQRSPAQQADDASEEFWALKDVTFDVHRGDVVGIIGRNGAGKSTLLKILSRITEPTEGRIRLGGRVASLLEVGTGFHPELTGRENIFLNGAILGMSKGEIRAKFDEIVAFAEVERFLDTPVKHYSSGMYVRLAFAVAAHLEPEILIVDEVLAVGDAQFQQKCMGKMQQVAEGEGRTILFVSHNMAAVHNLCSRAIALERGRVVEQGSTDAVIQRYAGKGNASLGQEWQRSSNAPTGTFAFARISVALDGSPPCQQLRCAISLSESCAGASAAMLAVDISDSFGRGVMQALPHPHPFIPGGTRTLLLTISLPPLIPGKYLMSFWLGSHHTATLDWVKEVIAFEVAESPTPGRTFPHSIDHGYIVPLSRCSFDL